MPRRPDLAERVHGWLLRAYPRAYRARFGEEQSAHFLCELDDARGKGGLHAVALWIRTVRDALWIAGAEHLRPFARSEPGEAGAGAGIRRRDAPEVREARRAAKRGSPLAHAGEHFVSDVRFAFRSFRRDPTFSLTGIVTVALGLGASATALSVFEAVFLRPLPYPEPDRLVQLREDRPPLGAGAITPADLVDWQQRNSVFVGLAGVDVYSSGEVNLTGDVDATRIRASRVTSNFFEVLGVDAAIGRTFDTAEERAGSDPAVVMGHGLWVGAFGADPSVLGHTVRVNDHPHRIIGVMPSDFRYPLEDGGQPDLWVSGAVTDETRSDRLAHTLHAVARLRPGATLEQARTEMDAIAHEISEEHPRTNGVQETGAPHGAAVFPFHEYLIVPIRASLGILLGAVAFVLLIAWVNLTNLLLARIEARDAELAVRTAIGGSRARVGRQLLTETFVLTLLGSLGGLLLARWCIVLLLGAAPPPGDGGIMGRGTGAIPLLGRAEVSSLVAVATLLLGLVTGAVCGFLPVMRGIKRSPSVSSRKAGPSGRSRTGSQLLVAVEVSLSVVLLIGFGLLGATMRRISEIPIGFDTSAAQVLRVELTRERYATLVRGDPGAPGTLWALRTTQGDVVSRTIEGLRAIPGVEAAGASSILPFENAFPSYYRVGVHVEGDNRPSPLRALGGVQVHAWAPGATVTPGYFQALGLPLLRGRGFTDEDGPSAPLVVIVNQALVHTLGLEEPVGRRLRVRDGPEWRSAEIVGVVATVRQFGYDRVRLRNDVRDMETIYLPNAQPSPIYATFQIDPLLRASFVVRHRGDGDRVARSMEEIFHEVDGDTPVAFSGTLTEYLWKGLSERRFLLLLVGLLSGLALGLATVGIYGVMAFHVGRRRHEIGIRMALGARIDSVVGMVVGEGVRVALFGALVGLAIAMASTRLLERWMYDVSPTDPTVFVSLASLIVGTAAVACLIPARRAARVDPVASLRAE